MYNNSVFYLEPESANSIEESINLHNITLYECAKIIELMAPVADYLSPDGAIDWLKRYLEKDDLL